MYRRRQCDVGRGRDREKVRLLIGGSRRNVLTIQQRSHCHHHHQRHYSANTICQIATVFYADERTGAGVGKQEH
uniref:Uncharacterized protein n=1 Tax=Anopheles dirus TaxID=7168 RepID=A0A182NY68_9DIPT